MRPGLRQVRSQGLLAAHVVGTNQPSCRRIGLSGDSGRSPALNLRPRTAHGGAFGSGRKPRRPSTGDVPKYMVAERDGEPEEGPKTGCIQTVPDAYQAVYKMAISEIPRNGRSWVHYHVLRPMMLLDFWEMACDPKVELTIVTKLCSFK